MRTRVSVMGGRAAAACTACTRTMYADALGIDALRICAPCYDEFSTNTLPGEFLSDCHSIKGVEILKEIVGEPRYTSVRSGI